MARGEFEPFSLAEVLSNVEAIKGARLRQNLMQQQARQQEVESKIQLHDIAAQMSRALVTTMNQSGKIPGTPEFQQELDRRGAPMQAELVSYGFPVQKGPMDWGAVQALAASSPNAGTAHSIIQRLDPATGMINNVGIGRDFSEHDLGPSPFKNLGQGIVAGMDENGRPVASPMGNYASAAAGIKSAEQMGKESETLHHFKGPNNEDILAPGAVVRNGYMNGRPTIPQVPQVPQVDPAKAGELPGGEIEDPAAMLMQAASLPNSHPDKAAMIKAAGDALVRKNTKPVGVGLSPAEEKSQVKAAELQAEKEGAAAAESAKVEGRTMGEASAKAKLDLPLAMESGAYMLGIIDKVKNHPGLGNAVGLSSINPLNKVPGTDAADFNALLEQLGGGAFLEAYKTLKGGGAITDYEDKKASSAIARLSTSQSEKQFLEALDEYRGVIIRGMKRAQELAKGSNEIDAAPSQGAPKEIDQIQQQQRPSVRLKYNPATGELE